MKKNLQTYGLVQLYQYTVIFHYWFLMNLKCVAPGGVKVLEYTPQM